MIQVTKKPKTPNMVWNAEKSCLLCKFVGGVLKTEDKKLADRLKALGHGVTEVKDQGGDSGGGAG